MSRVPPKKDTQTFSANVRKLSSLHIDISRTPTTLDLPRRIFHPVTGLVSITSLSKDVAHLLDAYPEITIAYVHLPNAELVEDRYGWEAHELFVGMCGDLLKGMTTEHQRQRGAALLVHAFADDFVLLLPHLPDDERLEGAISAGLLRHLAAMDPDLASVSKVYVGLEVVRSFSRVHNERLVYRGILEASARAMDVEQRELMAQARLLDQCLDQSAFKMFYQPIVCPGERSIFGYEALVRCQAPALANPLMLFDIAERSGRVRLLNRALRALTLLDVPQIPRPEHLFINLHVDDFDDPLVLDPPPVMREHATRIVLEVTERAAIRDVERFKANLDRLRGMGFHIALDDLGSGYSALSTLAEVVPEFIKLDMALIRGIDQDNVRQNLVRNIRSFADDLDVKVVAEGVETQAEYATVCELGCHLIQGYYFGRPAPPFLRQLSAEF